MDNLPQTEGAPIVHICGERSGIINRVKSGRHSLLSADIPHIEIPDSDHHIMLDQPLALVAALRGVLATWKPA
jgi:pimeloyl-ACP methyl ester carboxylesterase